MPVNSAKEAAIRGSWTSKVNFISGLIDLLRDIFRPGQYRDVILPIVVLRRLDYSAENRSPFTFESLLKSAEAMPFAAHFRAYIAGFPSDIQTLLSDTFHFDDIITRLDEAGLLRILLRHFSQRTIDLSPAGVTSYEMGLIFEELGGRFNQIGGENTGEYFTPPDVVELAVKLLIKMDIGYFESLESATVYDPCSGTAGMLLKLKQMMTFLKPDCDVELFGQELNPETHAISKLEMCLVDYRSAGNIKLGSTLSEPQHQGKLFDYMIANPPYGKNWRVDEKAVKQEMKEGGRFDAGVPRVSDGQLLFLQEMLSHMKAPDDGGTRIALITSGSALFTGDAGSGESNIRRMLIENDLLDTIVGLPNDLFYNTGIGTYLWLLTNNKPAERRGQVRLIDGREVGTKMRRNVGQKRVEIDGIAIQQLVDLYLCKDPAALQQPDQPRALVFPGKSFGYRKLAVIWPEVNEHNEIQRYPDGTPKPGEVDTEHVALDEDVQAFLEHEVLPHRPEAWIDPRCKDAWDGQVGKVGYEINFNRYFYVYEPPRPLEEIMRDIKEIEAQCAESFADLFGGLEGLGYKI